MKSSSKSSNASQNQQPDWLRPQTIPSSAQDAARKYDKISETYDSFTRTANYKAPESAAELLSQIIDQSDSKFSRASTILDAGCGTGLVGLALANTGFTNITGFDISPNSLSQAQAKQVYQQLLTANLLEPLPFDTYQFEIVLCIGVFSRFDDTQIIQILTEFARITQPGGRLLFSHRSDLMERSELTEKLVKNPQFSVDLVTTPLPYLPDAEGYEEIGVQYVVLTNIAKP
jgi:ubiquinone/menaquinone biosynthesis C-methylase UbiE